MKNERRSFIQLNVLNPMAHSMETLKGLLQDKVACIPEMSACQKYSKSFVHIHNIADYMGFGLGCF